MGQRKLTQFRWFLAIFMPVLLLIGFWFWHSKAAEENKGTRRLPAGHRKMLAALKEIAERTPNENPYFGDYNARRLRGALEKMGANVEPAAQWQLYADLGEAELLLGNLEAAIINLAKAHELALRLPLYPENKAAASLNLGVAYMRLGETQNCIQLHTAESCILPIQGSGLHTKLEGSTKAIQYFREVLDYTTKDSRQALTALWLMNIAYMTLGRYPQDVPKEYLIPPKAFEPEIDFPRFRDVAPMLGLETFQLAGGAIADDFNNDGYLDIVFSNCDVRGNIRFLGNNGDGTFTERTKEAGLTGLYGGLNINQADYNNDGYVDILVLRGGWWRGVGRHPNSLLRNKGDGTFTDVTFESGLGNVHYPTQTAGWADYDNDGDLDLFIGNETSEGLNAPCQLFRNNGDGTFSDVAAQAGVNCLGYIKGVAWGDYNNDRYPDLYLSNLRKNNRLYRNNRDGTFTEVAEQLGVTDPQISFPCWFWDFDNDGVLDLYVASFSAYAPDVASYYLGLPVDSELPALYRGDGHGGFQNVTAQQKLTYPVLAMGSNFGDLNNDGYLDFYLGTGNPRFETLMPNLMFLNQGGRGFVSVTMAGGFGNIQKGHGVAFADLDNDGDSDVFEQMGGQFHGDEAANVLFENPGFGNHWITVKLVGTRSNRSAIGARIKVTIEENGKTRAIYRHVTGGSSFGGNPLRQTIGLGKATAIRSLEIFWPTTGRTQRFSNVSLDQSIQIVEGQKKYTQLRLKKLKFRSKAEDKPAR